MPKPSIVTQKVFHAASISGPLNSMNSRAICSGLGKMNSGTLNSVTISCHSTSTAASTISGDQRSVVLADAHHVFLMAPMCPRSSCTMSVNCGV